MPKPTKITKRMLDILRRCEDGESLVCANPGGWWIENEKTSGPIGFALLRMCLISPMDYSGDDMTHYYVNETGRMALEDPKKAEAWILDKLSGKGAK